MPLFQGLNHWEHLFICNQVVPFLWHHGVGNKDNRVPYTFFYRQHCPCSIIACIAFKVKFTVDVWKCQYWCWGKMELEHIKCYLLGFFPMERVFLLSKVMKGSSHLWIVFNKHKPSVMIPPQGLYFSMDLSFFPSLTLSYHFRLQTMRRFSTRTHLSHALHILTNMCLLHGKPYAFKLKLILDSSFLCCAWLCCHTHVHHTFHASLPFCHHHMVASCSHLDMPFLNSINKFTTNMYIIYDSI